MSVAVEHQPFGGLPDSFSASLFKLGNDRLRIGVTDYGARLTSVELSDGEGGWFHVLLGLKDAASYATAGGSFGAVLGRCANRIADGAFVLGGKIHHLATNDDGSTRHGGPSGFGMRLWQAEVEDDGGGLRLTHHSPDGDQGFPGAVTAAATYRLDGATLWLTLEAVAEAPTVVNLAHHPYFNFSPDAADVLGHEVAIDADHFLPTDSRQIPTGEVRPVEGTPFDFRTPTILGARIHRPDPQLKLAHGYDHCFVLARTGGDVRAVASIRDPASGRGVELLTTQPGLQLYSGNSLNGTVVGRDGSPYSRFAGVAIEAQGFPDAPNHPRFPSVTLRPGQAYRHVTGYRFHF